MSARPSRLGDGLLDVALDGGVEEPLPSGSREIFQIRYDGGPAEPNLWARYDRLLRRAWLDPPSTITLALTNPPERRITSTAASSPTSTPSTAPSERRSTAPGGYFGKNLDALHDCLCGGWGATVPFRLIWHLSDAARRHLVPGYDRPTHDLRHWAPNTQLNDLLRLFTEHHVEFELH